MSNDAFSRQTLSLQAPGQSEDQGEEAPPRFTLSVQMDGRPESDRLAQVVRRAACDASGPDLIRLVPFGIERWNKDAALECRGTLVALPGAVGCVISQTLVTLEARGELALLHSQIAQADRSDLRAVSNGTHGTHGSQETMAEIMEDTAQAPAWNTANAASGERALSRSGAASGMASGAASEAALLELRSRVARLEGALVGQLTARLDGKLGHLATREEMQDVAQDVAETLAAVTAMKALVEQQQDETSEQQRQQEQQKQEVWRQEMMEEMRLYRQQVEALLHDNEALKSQLEPRLGPRWWQVWQRWKM
jgi:hypothetical protein